MATEFNFIPFDGYHLTDSSATGGGTPNPIPLGTVKFDETATPKKKYIWGQVATALTNDTLAANEVVHLSSATSVVFTNTLANGVGTAAGTSIGQARANATIPESTATKTYYGWFQIGGIGTIKTNGDNDGVAGDGLTIVGNGTANVVATAATSADGVILRSFATCLAAEASSAVSALIHPIHWAGM